MRFVIFCHSLISDWNHGNAHFLRGVVTELMSRRHEVAVYEPVDAWSMHNLLQQQGAAAVEQFRARFPFLRSHRYDLATLDLDVALDGADVVIAHEWNDPRLIARLNAHRRTADYRLLFHDTHHRAATARREMQQFQLDEFDGVLAFGRVVREIYLEYGWVRRAWVWHEAADHRVFRPMPAEQKDADVVWIGNWGDEERTVELAEYLIGPIKALRLRARVHGVRYPEHALRSLSAAGIEFGGWLPNYETPRAYARAAITVHVPRRPYARALPGIPTIRMFEALACGIPLISAPWHDIERLFTAGRDFVPVRNGAEMERALKDVLHDSAFARALAISGRESILARHTCVHRVDELLAICAELDHSKSLSDTALEVAL